MGDEAKNGQAGAGADGGGAAAGAGAASAGAGAAGGAAGAAAAGGGAAGAGNGSGAAGAAAAGAAAAAGGVAAKGWWETPGAKLELKPDPEIGLKPAYVEKLTKWAQEHKLSADQVNAMFPILKDYLGDTKKEQQDAWDKHVTKMKDEIPKVFGSPEAFEQAKKDTATVFEKFGDKRTLEFIDKRYLRDDPEFALFTARIGAFLREKLSPDNSAVHGARPGGGSSADPKARRVNAMYKGKNGQAGNAK